MRKNVELQQLKHQAWFFEDELVAGGKESLMGGPASKLLLAQNQQQKQQQQRVTVLTGTVVNMEVRVINPERAAGDMRAAIDRNSERRLSLPVPSSGWATDVRFGSHFASPVPALSQAWFLLQSWRLCRVVDAFVIALSNRKLGGGRERERERDCEAVVVFSFSSRICQGCTLRTSVSLSPEPSASPVVSLPSAFWSGVPRDLVCSLSGDGRRPMNRQEVVPVACFSSRGELKENLCLCFFFSLATARTQTLTPPPSHSNLLCLRV